MPSNDPAPLCYDVEISILYDNSPLGKGWVLAPEPNMGEGVELYFPPDNSVANQLDVRTVCLAEGSYKFTLYNSFGGGFCCSNGKGGYSLLSGGFTIAQGGEFAYSEEVPFDLPVVAVDLEEELF